MHLKLTQPGYENFTGQLGAIDFTDGVSDYGVSPRQAEGVTITVAGELVHVAPADPAPEEPAAE